MHFALLSLALLAGPSRPISLHPANPHYLQFRGKPTVLITSGEHYGAVLNLDFDYVRYLDRLKDDGLNLTRTFSGVYREVIGDFKIRDNTLAPPPDKYMGPWMRTSTPGANDGRNKFDLTKFNEAYFVRLKDFVKQAGRRGIVVEMVLFCPFYEKNMWYVDPMNAENNVNGIGKVARDQVYRMDQPELVAVHDAVTRRIVRELNEFDNVYFEICNEPYFGGDLDWQRRIAATIIETESALPKKHLIAQNIANGSAKVDNPFPMVSIFNFHYAAPPNAVKENWSHNRAISFDESGFVGTEDKVYRSQAWNFMIAGGAIFDNLDYSFTALHPDGTALVTPPTPGGGSPFLRRHLMILRRFLESFEFIKMAPDYTTAIKDLASPVKSRILSEPGRAYAVYFEGGGQAAGSIELPKARYRAEWIDTHTGQVITSSTFSLKSNSYTFRSPEYTEDIALRLVRTNYPKSYE